jgi:Conserved oligomeric complex COG6
VGDMLAWVHQAVASENELLGALMTSEDSAPVDPSTSGSTMISTPELLDKVPAHLTSTCVFMATLHKVLGLSAYSTG